MLADSNEFLRIATDAGPMNVLTTRGRVRDED